MAILFVSGVNDLSTTGVAPDGQGGMVQRWDGNCSIHGRVPLKKDIAGYVFLFGKGVQQAAFNFVQAPSLIINQIADADTHRGSLERCMELCAQVASPVINRAEQVLRTTREQVSESLQGIPGVIVPKTVRFQPASPEDVLQAIETHAFDFPVLVRRAGARAGDGTVLIRGPQDSGLLHAFPFDGRDFYLTQYVDFGDPGGMYHRQRIAVIDGEPVLCHSLFNDQWKVDAGSRDFMLARESLDENERRSHWLETEMIPALRPAFGEIHRRLKLDFFGIDCSFRPGGELLVFEANANVDVLNNPFPETSGRIRIIHQNIRTMLERHSGEAVI